MRMRPKNREIAMLGDAAKGAGETKVRAEQRRADRCPDEREGAESKISVRRVRDCGFEQETRAEPIDTRSAPRFDPGVEQQSAAFVTSRHWKWPFVRFPGTTPPTASIVGSTDAEPAHARMTRAIHHGFDCSGPKVTGHLDETMV